MEIVFTNARFIYRETDLNIYGITPISVSVVPDPTANAPIIVECNSKLYEKCVYTDNTFVSANAYLKSGDNVLVDVLFTSSDNFVSFDRYDCYYSITVEQNKSSVFRCATITASSNVGSVTFKVFQERINPNIIFTNTEQYEYKNQNDATPVSIPVLKQVGGNYFEHRFNTLLEKTSNKKEILKVFSDRFLTNENYIVSSTEKFVIDVDYDGNPVNVPSFVEYGASNSPQYIISDGKIYHKVMGLRNGKNTPIYEEGVLVDGEFYYKSNYDDPFRIGFDTDGSLSITNYGRCFLEPKAFYLIKISHKYSPTATGVIKITYFD